MSAFQICEFGTVNAMDSASTKAICVRQFGDEFGSLPPWKQQQLANLLVEGAPDLVADHELLALGMRPQPTLDTLPRELLNLILEHFPFNFTSLNGLEATSTALGSVIRDTWAARLEATFTKEARWACEATSASAKQACCNMLRCPFIFWGDTHPPARAKEAIDALYAVGGVIECPACWPIAIKPSHLARWWSVQALAKAFLMLSELQLGSSSALEHPWAVTVYAQTAATDLRLLTLCDALREGRLPCEPGEVIRRTDGLARGYSSDSRQVGPNVRPGNFVDGTLEPSAARFRATHPDPEDFPAARYHPFDDPPYSMTVSDHAEGRRLACAVVDECLFGGKASTVLDFLERSDDGEECFDESSLPWAGTDTGCAKGPDGTVDNNHGWGGVDWDAGREWWGCYCWVALRTLTDVESASEFAQKMEAGEETLAMLQLAASTTD